MSVVLPVLNEEQNLAPALASVTGWTSEVFVVDSGSTDRTAEIATASGATVVQFSYDPGGPKKKAWALRNLPYKTDWVLFLDGDERVPSELRAEIEQAVNDPVRAGFYIDRRMIFRGRDLRSYRPDWNLRLFRHAAASMEDLGLHDLPGTGDNEIHEHFLVPGEKGFLKCPLLHEDYRGIGPWIQRHNKYATWEAHLYRRWRDEPVRLNLETVRDPIARNRLLRRVWVRLPGRPALRFAAWIIVKRGFRDGRNGFLYAMLMAWYELLIGLKLAELKRQTRG